MSNYTHDLYKQFLSFAVSKGVDLDYMQEMYDLDYESDGMDSDADHAVSDFQELMYDFIGVNSVEEDSRVLALMECPGIYEINHPNNFERVTG